MNTTDIVTIGRRSFIAGTASVAGRGLISPGWLFGRSAGTSDTSRHPAFPGKGPEWLKTWDSAVAVLADNVRLLPEFSKPVLIEGSTYEGIWQECGPHESLVYASLREYVDTEGVAVLDVAPQQSPGVLRAAAGGRSVAGRN